MTNLWKQRKQEYQHMLLKYLRYVLNDHFVIALLFIAGGLGLYYSNFLKTLSPDSNYWWARPIVILILLAWLQLGHLATLVQRPDYIFLLPRIKGVRAYLKQALKHSNFVCVIVQACGVLVLFPFLMYGIHLSLLDAVFAAFTQVLLKVLILRREFLSLFDAKLQKFSLALTVGLVFPLLVLLFGFYLNIFAGWIISLIAIVLSSRLERKEAIIDWRYTIQKEEDRMTSLYRFFNLFTDVPAVQGKIKRRKYLDWLLPKAGSNPYSFLFSRGFVRNTDFCGTYLRLVILTCVILVFVKNTLLADALAVLLVYAISVQLVPLINIYRGIVFTYTLPFKKGADVKALRKTMNLLLSIAGILFWGCTAFASGDWKNAAVLFVILCCEIPLLTGPYTTFRLKKNLDTLM